VIGAQTMPDDESHFLGGAERRRDDQIALAFAIFVIGHDDEFAAGEGMQNFLDRVGHFLQISLGAGQH